MRGRPAWRRHGCTSASSVTPFPFPPLPAAVSPDAPTNPVLYWMGHVEEADAPRFELGAPAPAACRCCCMRCACQAAACQCCCCPGRLEAHARGDPPVDGRQGKPPMPCAGPRRAQGAGVHGRGLLLKGPSKSITSLHCVAAAEGAKGPYRLDLGDVLYAPTVCQDGQVGAGCPLLLLVGLLRSPESAAGASAQRVPGRPGVWW